MSGPSLIDQTKAAIAAMSNPAETARANEWLVEFERSAAAWEVADALVREENGSCRFFGAKFLYSKVQKQYIQLDPSNVGMLTQSLVQHILRISQEQNVEFNVCRYLCLALAALALQMNQTGILSQILTWLNPIISVSPNVLLELLIVLPEEAYNYQIDIASSIRSGFIQQLTDTAPDVLSFLSSLWPNVSLAIQAKILTCAAKWIDTTSMPSDLLVTSAIYPNILQSLNSPENENFESAIDAMIVILQRFRCVDRRILDSALPVILSLRSRWIKVVQDIGANVGDDVDDDDRNTCRALTRIFTETAEACMDIFVSTNNNTNIQQGDILAQLLDCTRIQFDASICRIPLKFFYDLAMMAKVPSERNNWSANNSNSALSDTFNNDDYEDVRQLGQNFEERRELNARYVPVYQVLLEIALGHIVLSPKVLEGSVKMSGEMYDQRSEWTETILDCCYVLGGVPTMQLLCQHLQQLSQASNASNGASNGHSPQMDWCRLESVLVAVQAAGPFLPKDEASFTPEVLHFAANLPENLLRLRITVIELFGKFDFWLAGNPSYVNNVLSKLFQDLQRKDTCSAAAKAIMAIFRTCSHLPNLPIQELHEAVLHLRNAPAASFASNNGSASTNDVAVLSLDSELLLLEAIAAVLSQMPQVDAENGFKMVLLPIVTALNQQLQGATAQSVNAKQLTPHVDRITVLFQYFRTQSGFVTEMFISVLPLFQRLLELCPTERAAEKCCRCYKHALRNLGIQFVPYLGAMTTHLAEQFARTPYSAFVYGCSTCISTFSLLNNGAHVELLYQMVWKLSASFFAMFSSLAHFEQKPDVVEEYFFLMAKALQYCPAPFIQSPQEASTVLRAGIQGLALKHREAQKGILLFFERFVQLSTFWPDEVRPSQSGIGTHSSASGAAAAATTNPLNLAARELVKQVAPALMNAICVLLSGEMPAYALDESNGCICDVLWYLKKRFKDEFPVWMQGTMPSLSQTAQKVAQSQQLVEQLSAARTLREFSGLLDRYELACRRNV
eukprot:CAMPEP_0184979480 /NCGR_PEP_ID=MMETSP1098-20130426/9762_1 /TAXON_ID=89044 /ORGANISM="Spumella elongata, Strain CCAP 955/1" /LENGTH=1016 /DNA_ID=CAMNT_0027502801 /DNA_START=13 /DNA_END=3063 /DNA_ORIENTATION=+